MSARRTATPLLTSTLVIAAGATAILVGCTKHTATPAEVQAAAASSVTAYDDTSGQVTSSSAAPGSYKGGDAATGSAAGENTTGNAATGITQPGALGETSRSGAPASSGSPG